jgi:hypothetical protein
MKGPAATVSLSNHERAQVTTSQSMPGSGAPTNMPDASACPCGKTKRGRRHRFRPIARPRDRVSVACRPAHVVNRRQSGRCEADLVLAQR